MNRTRSLGFFFLVMLFLSAVVVAQMREPLPVPSVGGYKTLKCDFHLHTVISDGEVWPTTRVSEAWRDGLDVIAITDHVDYSPHKEVVKIDLAGSYALARPVAERLGVILIPGIEIAEKDIHCNALFVTDPNLIKGGKLIESLRQAHAQNAFVFWNHPGWKQPAQWFPLIAAAYDQKLLQGMELVNGNDFYPEAYPWVDEKKLTIFANSDAHEPIAPTQGGIIRPVTLVFARTADVAGVREALLERRTAAWMGGEVWGAESFLRGLWEGAVKVENPELNLRSAGSESAVRMRNNSAIPFRLRVRKAPAWLRGMGGDFQLRGQSIWGQSVEVARNTSAGSQSAEIELEVLNFHVGPGKNLIVRLPLTIHILP